ncbi:hypothetical protein GGI42DRAFT_112931 [Trichoderma sp. SZMC 28013]
MRFITMVRCLPTALVPICHVRACTCMYSLRMNAAHSSGRLRCVHVLHQSKNGQHLLEQATFEGFAYARPPTMPMPTPTTT